ncbi:MAG: hypothetical protein K2O91_08765 [Lachnospiraceae bacterium]|nr:hypothetical protein [Lachnospiraceae bacterium]
MAQQERMPGTARVKRNCWMRGNGSYSYRGELKRGISLNKKYLNPISSSLCIFRF